MESYLKITVCLLLFVQTCQLASLPESTDSPGRTIDKEWFREVPKKKTLVATEEPGYESESFAEALDSNNVDPDGIPSGSMMVVDENRLSGEASENTTSGDPPLPPQFSNHTDEKPEMSNATVASTNTTKIPSNPSQVNMTGAEEEPDNSTMTNQTSSGHSSQQNQTNFDNSTNSDSTALVPEENKGLDNSTEGDSPTTTTTEAALPSETTGADPEPTTPLDPFTPETANYTDKDGASGDSEDRGVESDPHKSNRHGAWGAVLGTAVAVGIVGLVAYVILKKKHQMGFSHRKLVEVYPSDPVLRLDNSEPLDLNFGGRVYDNPGLTGDNFQMSNFPGDRKN